MLKTKYDLIHLKKGVIYHYSFPVLDLYVYQTNDLIDDQVLLLVKDKKMVVIESPCFYENIVELEEFIASLNVEVEGVVLAYHMAGGTFLPRVKKYATPKANTFGTTGGGKGLVNNFSKAFGNIFDANIHGITNLIPNEALTIGGISFKLVETEDAFDLIFPEINVIYTHMLGHDCHSIIPGPLAAGKMLQALEDYQKQEYALILTSHHMPEDLEDVKVKINYIHMILKLVEESKTKEEFIERVKKEYPSYSGFNYLEITARIFFS